ncbi:MAG: polysaccharide biosynthesis tyrosine autokinase [Candidatus Binatia bacterium]|nr:polysaccharide biosynthesis tyrosine autokinase [Candidatus Binatia bacterium]
MREISSRRIQPQALLEPTEAEYVYPSTAEETHLRDYWKIVVKRRWLIIFVFLALVALGGYFSFTATPLYKSTSIIKIEPQIPTVTGVGEMVRLSEGGGKYDYYETQFALLESRTLAARIITDLALDRDKSFTAAWVITANPIKRVGSWIFGKLGIVVSLVKQFQSADEPADPPTAQLPRETAQKYGVVNNSPAVAPALIGLYQSLFEVKPIKSTRLVEISFATPNPGLSRILADSHAKAFIQMNRDNRFDLSKEAREFLDVKNEELKKKLEQSEDALNRYRQEHGVVSMDKGENIVVERLVAMNQQLTVARGQRLEAESLYRVVENKSTQYLAQVLSQGLIPAHRSNLLALENEKVKLSTVFKPDHPRIMELTQQMTESRRALNTEINNVVRGIQENFFATRAKEQAIQAEAQKQQQTALNLKQVGVEFAVLEEEVKVNRAVYESVLRRLSETSVSNDLAISNMQITQHAERSKNPSEPDIALNLALSAVLGLIMGVGLVFLLEYLDSSVSTPKHVWRAVALTTFGVVPELNSLKPLMLPHNSHPSGAGRLSRLTPPRLPPPSGPAAEIVVAYHPLSIVAEAYRIIRTAVLFSQAEKPPQVILLTSPSPSEGKTLTTVNLAIALAQDGHKVMVIDGDLRKGCCHTRLGMKNHRGLSNVLTGQATLEESIQPTSVSGLSLLSHGVCPPNPSDLLGSNKMRQLLATLRESFDFILIDSAPVIALSDTAVTSIMCDGVILVFHGTKTTAASARQAIECLDAVRAPILGAVLNAIDLKNPDYAYYRRYYGSDYGVRGVGNNGVGNNGDGGQPITTDTATAVQFSETELGSTELGSGTISRQFIDKMTAKLAQALGPMAVIIVPEQVALLGESLDKFPKNRLRELFERVGQEILNNNLRRSFETAMIEELKSL